MTLSILKSAHKIISLNNTVQDNSGETSTFKFGSKIVGINMFGNNNESVPLKNEREIISPNNSVQDNAKTISSINNGNNESVPLKDRARVNITLELLPEVSRFVLV